MDAVDSADHPAVQFSLEPTISAAYGATQWSALEPALESTFLAANLPTVSAAQLAAFFVTV